ncbi:MULTISPECIES: hypothetical protein [Morganellaceae]|uniref:Uncharacterized protein n=3 Tax=Morganellaceae TaxID=1903414 RepID=A0A1B8HM68_9GAMM|nr:MULTISPECIES: hypothetical protein [Morganellaceae]OBU10513.1 hypothetical protein AYY17_15295 [Morganella psychrotolerans]QCJ72163.1 hypothetical protein C9446_20380 [Providencia heimbachae]UNH40580.1 hypothetical protein MNY70_17215 [Moellerella wisconsensis]UNH44282.1 hypothetical protein MNY66_16165 [Moellerella wisconsensis]WJW83645.1 hypothetical protein QU516_15620 [Moellerella wisconsensis]
MAKYINFDTSVVEPQSSFTVEMIDDLVGYVQDNSPSGRSISLFDTLPVFEETFVINTYHPMAPDSLEIHFFRDDAGNWWPYMTVDALCLVNKLTAYGYGLMDSEG